MFNPRARISDKAAHDKLLRDRAIEEAGALFRSYGASAIDEVSAGLTDLSKTLDERRHARLMIVELERLDRLQRQGPPATSLVVWKPPLFSLAWLRSRFGGKRNRWR
jgi:hypothetical protein